AGAAAGGFKAAEGRHLHARQKGQLMTQFIPSASDRLGAHVTQVAGEQGVRFAVWAPNARSVAVVGDFNAWDGRRHAMHVDYDTGIWELFIPGLETGALYKYALQGQDGRLLPFKA